MLQMIIQSILKSLSGMSCIAVILADASALSGIFMGYSIVKSTQLVDPIMTVIFGSLLLSATFIDIFNQAIGLIFALCYEMKWMLRLYMALTLTVLVIRCSIVCKPPVAGLKSAPFLGRPWTASNTPYDQMDHDLLKFYSQSPLMARHNSLSTFERKLHCCGVNDPVDYSAKFAKPSSCSPGSTVLPEVAGTTTVPISTASNTSSRLAPGGDNGTTVPAVGGTTVPPVTGADTGTGSTGSKNGSSDGGGGGGSTTLVAAGKNMFKTGCRTRVWAVWEGSKIAFDATVSAITFAIITVLLTVAWCELWGEGLLTGIECCAEKPAPKAELPPNPSEAAGDS